MQTAVLGLRQGLLHDLGRDAGNLDVHLQRGDARCGARNLEVHVAEVILVAQDVGQHGPFAVIFQDQTHRHTGDRGLQRHARVHHGQDPPQTDAIEDEPFDSVISDTTRIV